MPIQAKEVKTLLEFVEAITNLRKNRPADNAQEWFFRGQKNSGWDVRPNVFRGDDLMTEHILIDKAQRQNPIEFRECTDNFEILTKLQHYGLGTRLLDVTLNPLVALYFATEPSSEYVKNKNNQYSHRAHDGVVYYRFANSCALKDLQMCISLAIPFLDFGKSISLMEFAELLINGDIVTQPDFDKLIDNEFELMITLLQRNSFVVAANSNVRLIQQRGAFLISPSINIETNIEIKSSIISKAKSNLEGEFEGKYIIPEKSKVDIREELDFVNVNEATLFPELEHQMVYIQNQARVPIGGVDNFKQYINGSDYLLKIPDVTAAPKNYADILKIVNATIPATPEEGRGRIASTIENAAQVLDWQKKESSISKIRRSITSVLEGTMSDDTAKEKANEIIVKLLE